MSGAKVLRVPGGSSDEPAVQFLLQADRRDSATFYPHPVSAGGLAEVASVRGNPATPAAALTGGSWAVVTGQQACLMGGPLMIAWKALSAVAVARLAEAQLGAPVTPVFWAATEDHDLDEIRVVRTLDTRGQLQRRSMRFAGEQSNTPVQDAILGAEVEPLLEAILGDLPGGEHAKAVATDLRETHLPDTTAGTAFVALLRRWFGRFGLRVVEPRDVAALWSDPIEREARELFAGELVREAGERMASLGLPVTLEPAAGAQVYGIVGGRRLRGAPAADAQSSAAAALRPAWQDGALPTLAYVGGPSEVSYYGQLRGVHEHLGVPFPVVWPRASGTLLESSHVRIMEAVGIPAKQILRADLAGEPASPPPVPPEALSHLERLGRSIDEELEAVSRVLGDAELQKPLRKTAGSLHANLDRLSARIGRHFAAASGVDHDRRRRLAQAVRPEGAPQERKLATLTFLARHGPGLFDTMLDAIDATDFDHIVLTL